MLAVMDDADVAGSQEEPLLSCFRCGICCTKYQVRIDMVEARSIADELGIPWGKFQEEYLDQRWPGAESFLLRRHDGACVFFEQDKDSHVATCVIHHFRPSSCRDWTASQHRRECQEGLDKYWGLKVSAEGRLQGTRSKIQKFQFFSKSLG
jgi:Fe-S-cluster containining protein